MRKWYVKIKKQDESIEWINLVNVVKMVKKDESYYLIMLNGEKIQIPHEIARKVEKQLDD